VSRPRPSGCPSRRSIEASGGDALLAGPSAVLRAKLTEKTRFRPTAAVRPLMPAGAKQLDCVPTLRSK
jgi:hypothetical protein